MTPRQRGDLFLKWSRNADKAVDLLWEVRKACREPGVVFYGDDAVSVALRGELTKIEDNIDRVVRNELWPSRTALWKLKALFSERK